MKSNTDPLNLPSASYPDERKLVEQVLRIAVASGLNTSAAHSSGSLRQVEVIPPAIVKAVATIATNAWKAKSRMVDASGEPREEMKRPFRNIEAILDALHELEVEIKDRCGEAFDYGLPEKVVATQTQEGLSREKVIETIKPTIYWNGQIIQHGEVIIATPAQTKEATPEAPAAPDPTATTPSTPPTSSTPMTPSTPSKP
jgi:hypothetical protein